MTPETLPPGSTGSGSPGSGPADTVPLQPTTGCGQLVVELSTDKAVGNDSVPRPTIAAPSPDTVVILGGGSFGVAEGAPVTWVAVWVGGAVASVRLSSGGTTVDAMAPSSGIVVLAMPGKSELTGATVVGVDQNGSAVGTVPADQVPGPAASTDCSTVPPNPPSPTTTVAPTTTMVTGVPAPTNPSATSKTGQ